MYWHVHRSYTLTNTFSVSDLTRYKLSFAVDQNRIIRKFDCRNRKSEQYASLWEIYGSRSNLGFCVIPQVFCLRLSRPICYDRFTWNVLPISNRVFHYQTHIYNVLVFLNCTKDAGFWDHFLLSLSHICFWGNSALFLIEYVFVWRQTYS